MTEHPRRAREERHARQIESLRVLRREVRRASREMGDLLSAARVGAARTRERLGYVPLPDRVPHYLHDLGLHAPEEPV
ncbi:hypothetical protein DAETH_48330 (plasmid) [Deinococcus aetherius]|uniref:Uncharacterized protein n=1 Tax=Deinococcus aetherius TaxID=200252 RepID=A0ABN6RS12_9DEIO|nr:hypothetical protein [Deinococcus aetherius]BDP44864.1 hypothetical protein DAETH_48330 [Deinococcus aetherius]